MFEGPKEDWYSQLGHPREIKNLLTYLLTCVGHGQKPEDAFLMSLLKWWFGYIINGIIEECKNNNQTCLFQCINISTVSRKRFEPLALGPRVQTNPLSHSKC